MKIKKLIIVSLSLILLIILGVTSYIELTHPLKIAITTEVISP